MAKHDDDKGPGAGGASARARNRDATRLDPAREPADGPQGRQRIAKLMARAGLCSRRDAEVWVGEGRVTLNGTVLTSPAVDVGRDDEVLVDGLPLPAAEKTRLFLFHKPRGLVTSDHDPEGRPTVADHLRDAWPEGPRVVTVGRLDINTEGLLLLTNDGGLARTLELPRTGWVRRYRVRAKGTTDQGVLDGLRDGVTIDGVDYAGIEARLDRAQGSNCWLTMGLREGKNREVKRVLEHVGLEVNRLIRLSFGPFQLGELPEGAVAEVKTRILRDQLGEALAAQAGVDFHEDEVEAAPAAATPGGRTPRAGARDTSGSPPRAAAPARAGAPKRATAPRRATPAYKDAGRRRDTRDDDDDRAPPAKRERPMRGPRKHVSLLRAEPAAGGPRKRVARTSTRDSADRSVAVERLESVRAAPGRARPEATRPAKSAAARARALGAARRDDEAAPRRGKPHRSGPSPAALGKRERVLRSGGARGTDRSEDHAGRASVNRANRSANGSTRTAERSRERPGGGARPRPPRGDEPARGAGRRGERDRRGEATARPGRTGGRRPAGGPEAPRSARDGRPGGGRSNGGKPGGGGRPTGGGKPGGGKSGGRKPTGRKPDGGRPAGPPKR